MLRDRLLSSTALIVATVALLWLDTQHPLLGMSAVWLLPLVLFFSLGTAFDLATILRSSGRAISRRWVIGATAMVTLSPCAPMLWALAGQSYPANCPIGTTGWVLIGAVAAVFLLLFREILVYRPDGGALERTLGGAFASLYVGVPMASLILIRQLGSSASGELPLSPSWGVAAIVTVVAATKSSDAGAYFTGKAIGRHKLIPRISPGKTWEGAIGGIAVATLVSYGCFFGLIPALTAVIQTPPWWGPLVFGTICAVSGLIGDLAESLIKREAKVKDSGTWLPGLGGVWDVTDSLIAAVIPAWVMLASGLAGS